MTHSIRAFPVFLSVTLALVAGCAGPEVFDRVAAPESENVAAAPYPRLSDVVAPGPGPDPAEGDAVLIELGVAASDAEARLKDVSGPVQ
jgi:hypothetical protein